MLFVFFVDTGTMLTLEMDLALDTVGQMKATLAQRYSIPVEKQVLLISGGQNLDDEEMVCKYNAGIDTNPIFLFSQANIESKDPPEVPGGGYDELDDSIESRAETSLRSPVTQSTFGIRTSIAKDYITASSNLIRICETLIHDQHLQHQGWQAVVGNLEDTGFILEKRRVHMEQLFKEYLISRDTFREMVDTFDDDIAILHRIPVFPSLQSAQVSESMIGSVIHSPEEPAVPESMSLLNWINTKGSSQSLEQLADSCYRSIENLDKNIFENLSMHVKSTIEVAKSSKMKEVRGLSERLQGLEQLLYEAQHSLSTQQGVAQTLAQHEQRAADIRDRSLLIDLCAGHKEQFKAMSDAYQHIISIRKRCQKAKNELSANLHVRMKWVVRVQDQMAENGQATLMHTEEIKRLNRKMKIIEQLHAAPSMYLAAAVEVVRRKAFSKYFLEKGSTISMKFSRLYRDELALRKQFQTKLRDHFLSKMFPGMEDEPPNFATVKPDSFDLELPNITLSDVEKLRAEFPDLAKSLRIPDEDAFANLLAKSMSQSLTLEDDETLSNLQSMPGKIPNISGGGIGSVSMMHKLASNASGHRKKNQRLKNVRNDESESDTDDFHTIRSGSNTNRKKSSSDKLTTHLILTQSLPLDDSTLDLEPKLEQRSESLEFKVDKSVDPSCSSADPSSSSAGNTGNNTSVAPSSSSDGSVMKPEGSMLSQLNESKCGTKLNASTNRCDSSSMLVNRNKLSELKQHLKNLKESIHSEKGAFTRNIAETRESLTLLIQKMEEAYESEKQQKVQEFQAEEVATREKMLEHFGEQLNLENSKLEDCNRELEIYRQQHEQSSAEIDSLKTEIIDTKASLTSKHKLEMEQIHEEHAIKMQKVMLDHEFDLENLKMSLNRSEQMKMIEDEVKKLRSEVAERDNTVASLKAETKSLESAQEEKLDMEKEKIVQILEAGFVQREKLALEKQEEELKNKFVDELESVNAQKEKMMAELEEQVTTKMRQETQEALDVYKASHNNEILAIKLGLEDEYKERLSRQRKMWEEEHQREMKAEASKLKKKAKIELEALKSRFKMMQTTGALDRSPSASESELSIESPRADIFDNIRIAMQTEHENNLRAERLKWEQQLETLKEIHQKELEKFKTKERMKETAGNQVKFNEALKKVVEDKDAKLEEMKSKIASLEQVVANSENLSQKNGALEKELSEMKAALESKMTASILPLSANSSCSSLAEAENKELKGQLSQSMHAIARSGNITVNSVAKGDSVMIIWHEDNSNYIVYFEGSPMHFLHTESYSSLGLKVNNGVPNKRYITAEVVDKEYCQARRSENRFKVPQGARFFRVKCKPLHSNQ